MKTIEEIFAEGRPAVEIIEDLQSYYKTCPAWAELSKNFEPTKHPIKSDPTLRPKDKVKNGKVEKAAKLTYAAEKIATRRMTQMAFSIPVKRQYVYDHDNEEHKAFVDAIEKVYSSVRIDGVNAKRMFAYFGACEVATFWYIVDTGEEHNKYGFATTAKIRTRSYSPMPSKYSGITQACIYPLFDDFDDLIALSVSYDTMSGNKPIKHFDCFTADNVYYFKQEDGDWTYVVVENATNKIPAMYISRQSPVYDDISDDRNEIEFTMSRNSDSIRKNSNPIMKVSGELIGEKPVGDTAREVYQMKQGGDINLISPSLTTQNAKEHIDMLKMMIEESTQLPNLSMENVKSLGAISGESRKTLLTDAHLRVKNESHDIVWGFDREFNVIKSLLCKINLKWEGIKDEVTCQHIITPFIQNDLAASIDNYTKACGEVVMSQKTAIEQLGLVEDAEAELEAIREEETQRQSQNQISDIFSGAM